jgi:hypothetical protein
MHWSWIITVISNSEPARGSSISNRHAEPSVSAVKKFLRRCHREHLVGTTIRPARSIQWLGHHRKAWRAIKQWSGTAAQYHTPNLPGAAASRRGAVDEGSAASSGRQKDQRGRKGGGNTTREPGGLSCKGVGLQRSIHTPDQQHAVAAFSIHHAESSVRAAVVKAGEAKGLSIVRRRRFFQKARMNLNARPSEPHSSSTTHKMAICQLSDGCGSNWSCREVWFKSDSIVKAEK